MSEFECFCYLKRKNEMGLEGESEKRREKSIWTNENGEEKEEKSKIHVEKYFMSFP